jgi:hypothetical protein
MKKYLMVIASYPDWRQEFFETYMSPRNKEYCKIHGFEYVEITEKLEPVRGKVGWIKPFKVQQLLKTTLKDGDILTCLDADMAIVKKDMLYVPEEGKSFAYSIDSGNTHCMGSYSVRANDWTRKLFDLIVDEERYNSLHDQLTIHERFQTYSSFWEVFYDQASWYSLAGIKRHSDIPFWDLPDFGWHSDKNGWTMYSLEELYENVQLLPTEWNVTELPGESGCDFLINRVNPNDVIIRHFAGGQQWRKEWFEK